MSESFTPFLSQLEESDTRGVEWPAEVLRSDGSAGDAPPAVPRQPQAGDLGEEVGWRPDLQDKVPDAGKPEAGRHGGWEHQEACLAVLPDQDGALSNQAVPQLDEESAHPTMLVVPVPELDLGAPLQGVSGVEDPAEDPVGGGAEGDWEVEDSGPPGGREVRAGGTGLPLHHGCGEADAGRGRRRNEVSEAELREWVEEQGAEELGAGEGLPLFLPTPDFMGSAEDE